MGEARQVILTKHAASFYWRIGDHEIVYDPAWNKVTQASNDRSQLGYDKASQKLLRAIFPIIWEADW